ncbi:methionyl-tRNA formyltransferase [Alkaliphilus peptidifermentans]|uniref:Methionyl-tRNA formyltransferase n=1 Tax=Alkaliphilus peptidifermentans DSM 18978 TaxID=1120976 RepID=A0A1G5JAR7_9FIRM|nr:methionyl-tRNA formyltransferase [Alkaliphilus peptidifermentans]SCY85412.1 methionyl-tRNA formyltransferase [Alkaliphilus peptidifermentans DSM 18978]
MRIIFMGTPEFAVPCLEALIEEKHEIIAVFTQPDKPKGRGNKITFPPIKEIALREEIPVFQPKTLKDTETLTAIKAMKPDIIVVVAYGQILTKEILEVPPFGCINVHSSLLPKYRGAAPINWVIINGEDRTGVTTMYMDIGLDTGDMILKEETPIGPEETAGELHNRLSGLGADILIKTIDLIEVGGVEREQQNEEEATYAPIMNKELGQINWSKTAIEIKNLIRGTIPWPGAFTSYNGRVMKIFSSRVEETGVRYRPGEIIEVTKDEIHIGTSKDLLIIKEIQFSGSKRMMVKDYLIGNEIIKGIIFGEDNDI